MEVQWRNLSVTIGQKQILAPQSGHVRPGRMVALMGPSGSGKTTLLSAIRQDISYQGEVHFDGALFSPALRQMMGFVEQDDVVLPSLTVRQTLMFLAQLRFGIGSAEAAAKVESIVSLMRLDKIIDSVIGMAGSPARISGGERKRLCIAREMLSEPKILMCDEPTSGLDSTMAEQVVASMKFLSDNGNVSVISAIHQPSTSIFGRFDDLILLREGEVLYYGPSTEAEHFFTSHAVARAPSQSTAEYLMDLLVIDASLEAESKLSAFEKEGQIIQCHSVGMTAEMRATVAKEMREKASAFPALAAPKQKQWARRYHAPLLRQLYLLTRRHQFLMVHEIFTWLALCQYAGYMFVASILWFNLGTAEEDVFPRLGISMWMMGTWMFFPLFGGLGTFQQFRQILDKELRIGCYSLEAFYVARTVMLLPIEFVWPMLFTSGFFWATRANPDFGVYIFALLSILLAYTLFSGMGQVLSASDMHPARTATASILLMTYFFSWTKFFVDMARVPVIVRWGSTVNLFGAGFELMANILMPDDAEYTCDGGFSQGMATKQGCAEVAPGRWILTGSAARERYDIQMEPWVSVVAMLGSMVFCRLLAYVLLRHTFRTAIDGARRKSTGASVVSVEEVAETKSDHV